MTGPVLGRVCTPGDRWAMKGHMADGRFSYTYAVPTDCWNFCALNVELSDGKATVEVELVTVPAPAGPEWTRGAPNPKIPKALLALTDARPTSEPVTPLSSKK